VTWTQLLANNEVQRHKTSKKELDKLRTVIARDLADASLHGVSADRRFATASTLRCKRQKWRLRVQVTASLPLGTTGFLLKLLSLRLAKLPTRTAITSTDAGESGM
jgi:hypothetical protein